MKLWELKQRQSLPLEAKIKHTQKVIKDWYDNNNGNVFIAYSGGKDSTVLLHLVRSMYPNTVAVFVDTGLEYPEIREFVKNTPNTIIIKPEKSFLEVIKTYGYPVISKEISRMIRSLKHPSDKNINIRKLFIEGINSKGEKSNSWKLPTKWKFLIDSPFEISEQCCYWMKKKPIKKWINKNKKYPYVGIMASNSRKRQMSYLRTSCNIYSGKDKKSMPLSIWTDNDIWDYINKNNINYCKVYDNGLKNTGCIYCMFGVHMEDTPNRFQIMKKTHPAYYKYCMETLGLKDILEYIGIEYE